MRGEEKREGGKRGERKKKGKKKWIKEKERVLWLFYSFHLTSEVVLPNSPPKRFSSTGRAVFRAKTKKN
jgi:hypothetical protein